jgi:serine/threonine protein kinase
MADLEGRQLGEHRIGPVLMRTDTSVIYSVANNPRLCFKLLTKACPPHLRRTEIYANQQLRNIPNLICSKMICQLESPNVGFFMQYCRLGDLLDYILRKPVTEDLARQIFWRVLIAIEALHAQNWGHRCIQPENIFLDGEGVDGEVPVAFLGDLSFAKPSDGQYTDPVGAPLYCAPELIRGEPFDVTVDMWAFGVCLFVTLALTPPFPDPSVPQERDMYLVLADGEEYEADALREKDVSREAQDLIRSCLKADPRDRITPAQAKSHLFFAPLNKRG